MQSLEQLKKARELAWTDGRYYISIIPAVLPIVGPNANASVESCRWGSDFLEEAFASPIWPPDEKETCALGVLPTLKDYLSAVDDPITVKSTIQVAASIYPLVYRYIISHPNDEEHWQHMTAIKEDILRRMDTAPPGVRICCVKFVQQVVLVQTPGMIADPRRPEQNDISLALVPRDHRLLPYAQLEAQAHGLLDRLLDIIHGDHSDALLITATLNCLGMLIQRRPLIANRILSGLFSFNPSKLANSPLTPASRLALKSIERTTRALLVNVTRRANDPNLAGRINHYLERMSRPRTDVQDENSKKRPAPGELTDGLDPAKRQRLGATASNGSPAIPPLPAGPVSYRDLFLLTSDPVASVDVSSLQMEPERMLDILTRLLTSVDRARFETALNAVRGRYLTLSKTAPLAANTVVAVDDEDEYEPDFEPEDAEQLVNRLDNAPPDNLLQERIPSAPLAPYKLPDAPPLTDQEVLKYGEMTIQRIFGMLNASEEYSMKAKAAKGGFNRLAASSYDRDSWVTILSRLATRATAGLDDPDEGIKSEQGSFARKGSFAISDLIREYLHRYIMYDWRKRIDAAVSWLNEEWLSDKVQSMSLGMNGNGSVNGHATAASPLKGNYFRCALKLLDSILPFVEGTDKVMLRFMSEIPELNRELLRRLVKMAEDPERVGLSIMVLKYLYMVKPPARELCVELLAEMWRTNDRARGPAAKELAKWKPEVLQEENEVQMETTNGAAEVTTS
ncbi:hypothetical protein EJ04DRAFT_508857 [Polyplosphaeria fusca]|uniref:Symplekin/Pta1 N-terminal domain-containing protein n=1 Tax=Polyplosphaeria fusca TaxID=682080 RepID=A0A9P4V852_9PLEO|nr:hypothetical protein EJ04DRAFT_508857 [Polyplosphaeria fusca]